ncbi:MAG: amidohydrolase family protein [Rikenellaceae bacterium]|jgi:cytosine/adenosine deaminase-related metal-dependent hydrolase|nr:amidohydrolase family protein [Rikenellaceae bacterium]
MTRKIGAKVVMPVSGEPIRNGVVTFDEAGRVTAVSGENGFDPACPGDVEVYDGVLTPGFVNTHSHLELAYMAGVLPPGTGLAGFIKRVMESKFTFPEEVQRKAIADADKHLWESGVQAVGDISNTTVSFETKKNSPIKYVTYAEIFDFMAGMSTEAAMQQGEEVVAQAERMGLEAYVTLHATYSVSDKLFGAWHEMKHTGCLSIHYRESLADDELFDRTGPFWDYFQEKGFELDFLNDGSSTNRILRHIPANRRVLLVHNSNVTASDIEQMKAKYERLSWALCPMSNLYIEGKLPPVELMSAYNLNLTIGTDSLSSNTDLSMVAEMRALAEGFNLPLPVVLRWATLNGAKALEMDREIGSFEVGKTPGAVLIEGLDEALRFTPTTSSRRLI